MRSHHTIPQIKNFIINEIQRYIRTCNNRIAFEKIKWKFFERLRHRSYSTSFLWPLFNETITPEINYKNRRKLLFSSRKQSTVIKQSSNYIICCPPTKVTNTTIVLPNNSHVFATRVDRIIKTHWNDITKRVTYLKQHDKDKLIIGTESADSLYKLLIKKPKIIS